MGKEFGPPGRELQQYIADAIFEGLERQEVYKKKSESNSVAGKAAPSEDTWITGYFYLMAVARRVIARLDEKGLLNKDAIANL